MSLVMGCVSCFFFFNYTPLLKFVMFSFRLVRLRFRRLVVELDMVLFLDVRVVTDRYTHVNLFIPLVC